MISYTDKRTVSTISISSDIFNHSNIFTNPSPNIICIINLLHIDEIPSTSYYTKLSTGWEKCFRIVAFFDLSSEVTFLWVEFIKGLLTLEDSSNWINKSVSMQIIFWADCVTVLKCAWVCYFSVTLDQTKEFSLFLESFIGEILSSDCVFDGCYNVWLDFFSNGLAFPQWSGVFLLYFDSKGVDIFFCLKDLKKLVIDLGDYYVLIVFM